MITPNPHLLEITRDSDIIEGRDNLICLDRNERQSAFSQDILDGFLKCQNSALYSNYPNLNPLYERLSAQETLAFENLAVGAGSDALIRRAFQAYLSKGDKVLSPDPSYGMYKVWAQIFLADYQSVPYGDGPDFQFDVDALISHIETQRIRICCIANPDQPTGATLSLQNLKKVARAAQENDTLFIIDEAYYPFHNETARSLVDEFSNVLVLRTFSKAAGIAGLRVGYAMGHARVIENLHKVRSPGEVNAVGNAIACHILDHPDIIETFRDQVAISRQLLNKKAGELGISAPKCAGNFQLLKLPDNIDPNALAHELQARGYLIKSGFSHSGLKQYVRVTLDVPDVIETFSAVLKDAFVHLQT